MPPEATRLRVVLHQKKPMPRVLNCSLDEELLELRATILQQHNCVVVSASTVKDALEEMNSNAYDVLLLCYQLGVNDISELCREFKRTNPEGRIVAIEHPTIRETPCEADVTISALHPPEMINAVTAANARPGV